MAQKENGKYGKAKSKHTVESYWNVVKTIRKKKSQIMQKNTLIHLATEGI